MRCYHAFAVLALAACGDNNKLGAVDAPQTLDTAPGMDAAVDMMVDSPSVTGTHTHLIVDKITVPTTAQQVMQLSLDLDGDGKPDNALGNVMKTLASQGFPIQATVDAAIDRGQALLLVDLQAESLTSGAASFVTWEGTNAMPPPCSSPQDMVCRHHLAGTGTFDLAADTWHDTPLVGTIASGALDAGPGSLTLQFPLFPGMPLQLTLLGARLHATGLADTSLGASILGGAVGQNDINTKLLPAVATGLGAIIARDCTMLTNPPTCGCASGSTGATIIQFFDANHDCAVTAMELQNNLLIQQLLKPDVVIDGMPGVSFGVGFTAVGATYTVPGE